MGAVSLDSLSRAFFACSSSFPRSAWERAVLAAPRPPLVTAERSRVCSHAERGNEDRVCSHAPRGNGLSWLLAVAADRRAVEGLSHAERGNEDDEETRRRDCVWLSDRLAASASSRIWL